MPFERYRPFPPIDLPDRTWPSKVITEAPRWLSTDLRDGNQALIDPMSPARKMKMFELLVKMGYKEIEVGFPSASETDFSFVRQLIEGDHIPDDVTISGADPGARGPDRAQRAVAGRRTPRPTSTSTTRLAPLFRGAWSSGLARTRSRTSRSAAPSSCMKHGEKHLDTTVIGYEYSPEIFTSTELAVLARGLRGRLRRVAARGRPRDHPQPAGDGRVRDAQRVRRPDRVVRPPADATRRAPCISLHPHNDRGTAVAATELAMMAGADRVEGCLFGHGERTGNVDLVTLGMNLFSQGIDPMIDFSDIDEIRRTVEYCTQLPVHPRHPYAGDLVYTAFSGSHQDAIKKGLEDLDRQAAEQGVPVGTLPWEAPYLPIDPKDVGRTYEAVIRVNSQSGKGGVAYILKAEHKLDLPRRAQIEFSRVIQERTDAEGGEMTPEAIWDVFSRRVPRPRDPAQAQLRAHLLGRRREGRARRQRLRRRRDPVAARRGQRPDRGVRQRDQRAARTTGTCGCSTTPSTPSPPVATRSRRRTSSAWSATRSTGASASTPTSSPRRSRRSSARSTARQRQPDRERGALQVGGSYVDLPTVGRHDRGHDRQSQPGALDRALLSRGRAEEALEEAGLLLGRDADPGVGDRQPRLAVVHLRRHLDPAAVLGELDRVAQQVRQRPARAGPRSPSTGIGASVDITTMSRSRPASWARRASSAPTRIAARSTALRSHGWRRSRCR